MLKTISFRQSHMQCGPASLKIVASYFGIEKTEKELSRLCKTSERVGTTGKNLLLAAKSIGLTGQTIDNSDFRTMKKWLNRSIPIIVSWFSPGQSRPIKKSHMAGGHYSVVVGLTKLKVFLEDPGIAQRRSIPRAEFLSVWFDYDGRYPKTSRQIFLRRLIIVHPMGSKISL